jgi:hypothetical protein
LSNALNGQTIRDDHQAGLAGHYVFQVAMGASEEPLRRSAGEIMSRS